MPIDPFKTQVLLLHSEQSTLDELGSRFNDRYTVHFATSGSDALSTLAETPINIIVSAQDLPGMSGLELQQQLTKAGLGMPIIFITGHGDIPMAVEAMRRGALDFIRKPFREHDLLERINEALNIDEDAHRKAVDRQELFERLASLSEREKQVFDRVADGQMNKVIAADLGISERTVEVHRGQVMKKLEARTLAQLVRAKIQMDLNAESPSING